MNDKGEIKLAVELFTEDTQTVTNVTMIDEPLFNEPDLTDARAEQKVVAHLSDYSLRTRRATSVDPIEHTSADTDDVIVKVMALCFMNYKSVVI